MKLHPSSNCALSSNYMHKYKFLIHLLPSSSNYPLSANYPMLKSQHPLTQVQITLLNSNYTPYQNTTKFKFKTATNIIVLMPPLQIHKFSWSYSIYALCKIWNYSFKEYGNYFLCCKKGPLISLPVIYIYIYIYVYIYIYI